MGVLLADDILDNIESYASGRPTLVNDWPIPLTHRFTFTCQACGKPFETTRAALEANKVRCEGCAKSTK